MSLGSGIWRKPIPDPGSRGQKGTGSRIRIRNTGRKMLKQDNIPEVKTIRLKTRRMVKGIHLLCLFLAIHFCADVLKLKMKEQKK
jgi:hypothetical protein